MDSTKHKQSISTRKPSVRQRDAIPKKTHRPCDGCEVLTRWLKLYPLSGCQDCNRVARSPQAYMTATMLEHFETIRRTQENITTRQNKVEIAMLEFEMFLSTGKAMLCKLTSSAKANHITHNALRKTLLRLLKKPSPPIKSHH